MNPMMSNAVRRLSNSLIALSLVASTPAAFAAPKNNSRGPITKPNAAKVARPPQYVLLGFDGSYSLDMWDETLDFARDSGAKFTYFISGVYFLLNSKKMAYVEPAHGPGKSAIGFGGNDPAGIVSRVGYVNRAFDEGNEIASHVNGHYDGSKWSLAQWASEFKQFYQLVFDVFRINNIPSPQANPYHFDRGQVVGFRAPLLGLNSAMYQQLRAYKYTYDTSKSGPMTYWPEKQNGIWNFPLAQIRIAGTGKRTLSMDYNFYYAQSGGRSNPALSDVYYREMLKSYLGYFQTNYYGNRAPVHIGHHFSKWNGGAYWRAFKDFTKAVCGMPEVKCVTYTDLVNYMESLTPQQVVAYRSGSFPKMIPADRPRALHMASVKPLDVDMKIKLDKTEKMVVAKVSGQHAKIFTERAKGVDYEWSLNGETISLDNQPALEVARLPRELSDRDELTVSVRHGQKEVLRATHQVIKPEFGEFEVAPESLEDDAVKGDLPGAHQEH